MTSTDYNYLKTLSKDILIKIISTIQEETQKRCLKERDEWLERILSNQKIRKCQKCYMIDIDREDFAFCEECDLILCVKCLEDSEVKITSCRCGGIYCSNCPCYC